MNIDVWNELSPQHQAIVTNATMATTHYKLSETLSNNVAALSGLQSQGVETRSSPMTSGMRSVALRRRL